MHFDLAFNVALLFYRFKTVGILTLTLAHLLLSRHRYMSKEKFGQAIFPFKRLCAETSDLLNLP